MDQFSAHLDRGWDLIQRGDARGAETSARRALEMDSDSPEVYNLLGYVAVLRGDFDEAAEHYRQAIALDDTYLEAILNAAELCIHPLGDFEEAERLCDDALELAEGNEERVDALLLKFDALLGTEKITAAKELCQRFPPGPFTNPAHSFLVGRAFFEVGDLERALPLIEEATQTNPDNAEAQYYLALLNDERGETRAATEAFLRSRELDLRSPSAPWSLSPPTFRDAVLAAVTALGPELRELIQEEEVYVAEMPGVEMVVDGVDPRALLMLDSLSPADDPSGDSQPHVRLFVYQRNVERIAGTVESIVPELTGALTGELQAHFTTPEQESLDDELKEERDDTRTLQ